MSYRDVNMKRKSASGSACETKHCPPFGYGDVFPNSVIIICMENKKALLYSCIDGAHSTSPPLHM